MEDLNQRVFFRGHDDIAYAMALLETLERLGLINPEDALILDITLTRRTWVGKI